MKRLLLILAICTMCGCFAHAYVLEGAIWHYGNVYLALMLQSTSYRLQYPSLEKFPLYDGSTSWEAVAYGAAYAWNKVINDSKIVVFYYWYRYPSGYSRDRVNEMFFGTSIDGSKLEYPVVAMTSYEYDPSNYQFIGAAICFNSALIWNSYWGPLNPHVNDFRRVATHELGHFIGLDHPDDYGQRVSAIMNRYESDTYTLQPDDINGAHALYGAP